MAVKTYVYRYYYDGDWCLFEIQADSPEDAGARIMRLVHAQYEGELVMKVPHQLGWFAKAYCAVRNWLSGG